MGLNKISQKKITVIQPQQRSRKKTKLEKEILMMIEFNHKELYFNEILPSQGEILFYFGAGGGVGGWVGG